MDLSEIPTEDLKALQSQDLSKVSTETLKKLSAAPSGTPATPQPSLEDVAGGLVSKIPAVGPMVDTAAGVAKGLSQGAAGAIEGIRGENSPQDASTAQNVGHFIGKEGPAIGGMVAAGTLTGGASLAPALGAAALGGGAGEAYRQLFGRAIGGNQISSKEAAHLISAQALKGVASEIGGRLTKKTFEIIRNMLPESLNSIASMPSQYIKRAIENPNEVLPKTGETLASVEGQAVNHIRGVQDAMEEGRREAGRAVDDALQSLSQKTGGQKIIDTASIADEMRNRVAEVYRSGDPTVAEIAKTDMTKIAKVLKTMESSPMKSVKDVVQIRRELDNLVGYTPQGVKKMESDLGERFAKELADKFRGVISKTAKDHGAEDLLAANSKFSDLASAYDQWQPVFNTKTEGVPHIYSKLRSLDSYISKGGIASESLNDLKAAFPGASEAVDSLHNALAKRAFISSPGSGEKEILKPLIRSIAGPGGVAAATIRGTNAGLKYGAPASRMAIQAAMPSDLVEAIVNHVMSRNGAK